MKKIFVSVLAFSLCVLACVKPEEEPTNQQQRQAKMQKYLQRAKTAAKLDDQRTHALAVPELINPAHVTNNGQTIKLDFLAEALNKNRHFLQNYLQKNYKAHSTEQLRELLQEYQEQTRQAAQEAASPWDLAAKMKTVQATHDEKMQQFISGQNALPRLVPDEDLLEQSRQYLSRRCDEQIEQIESYYGPATASAAQPVLDQAVTDYINALGSPIAEEQLEQQTAAIVQTAQQQLDATLHASEDPLGITAEEVQSSLRAEMIAAHQGLEQTIEMLYNKEAVLQAREVFTSVRNEIEKTLQANMYLTQKKASLEHLNADYKRQILGLQTGWNTSFALPAPILTSQPETNQNI